MSDCARRMAIATITDFPVPLVAHLRVQVSRVLRRITRERHGMEFSKRRVLGLLIGPLELLDVPDLHLVVDSSSSSSMRSTVARKSVVPIQLLSSIRCAWDSTVQSSMIMKTLHRTSTIYSGNCTAISNRMFHYCCQRKLL